MKRTVLTLMMSIVSMLGFSQAYMYVNKDTVFMRENPSLQANLILMMHPPTKIAVEEITDTTAEGRELAKDWVAVKFIANDGTWLGGKTYYGFVKREYLVPSLALLTVSGIDTTIQLSYTEVSTDSTPMRKGKIDFKETFTGQCYYLNSNAKREYVADPFCRRDDMEEQIKEELEEQ